jgi:putative heme-binding domain-containing protein
MPPADAVAELAARLRPALPSADRRVNEELAAMFAAFQRGECIPAILDLLERARSQEEQIVHADALAKLGKSDAWTPALRERFFAVVADRTPRWKGGPRVKPRVEATTKAAVALLGDEQRGRLAGAIEALQKPPAAVVDKPRSLVRQWTLADLAPGLEAGMKRPRDLANGQRLYTITTCAACHSFQGEGGLSGPDLTNVRGRFTPHDLLDNILNPSKVINQQYGQFTFLLHDGRRITGRPLTRQGGVQEVGTDPANPRVKVERIRDEDVESMAPSPLSAMPDGLLNTLTEDDILDLLAYLVDS